MLFLVSIYITIYLINMLSLAYLIKTTFNTKITLTSLPYMTYYIVKFSKLKNLYYGLILALTGIPPFILFFIKFNILISILPQVGFILFYIIFLLLFLHMIFYIQPIYLKNINFDLKRIGIKKKKNSFNEVFIINYLLTLLYTSVLFFPDIYLLFINIY